MLRFPLGAPVARPTRASPAPRASRLALTFALALATVPPCAARAQGAPDTLVLTLADAVTRAVRSGHEMRQARAQLGIAREQVRAARAAALPQLEGRVTYTRTFDTPFTAGGAVRPDSLRFVPDPGRPLPERVRYLEQRTPAAVADGLDALFGTFPLGRPHAYAAALTARQALYSGGRLSAARRIAREYEAAARLDVREQESEVVHAVRRAYVQAVLAADLETIARAALAQAERFERDQARRHEAGVASDLDVLRAEVARENLQPTVVAAANDADAARLELRRLLDLPPGRPLALVTALDAPALLPAPDDGPTRPIARPALERARRLERVRHGEVAAARGAFWPTLDVRVDYGTQAFPDDPLRLRATPFRRDVFATVELRLPILTGFRRSAELAAARLGETRARLAREQLEEEVALALRRATGERERARAAIEARRRTVTQAERVHALLLVRFAQGVATQLEVADARLALLQARTNLVRALADHALAEAAVARARGDGAP